MTERERLINSATDWCSRLFDYEVRGNGLTSFEGQALDIIKGLLILVEPEAASGASVPHPQGSIENKFFVAGQMDAQGHAAEKWKIGSGGLVLALSRRLLDEARSELAVLREAAAQERVDVPETWAQPPQFIHSILGAIGEISVDEAWFGICREWAKLKVLQHVGTLAGGASLPERQEPWCVACEKGQHDLCLGGKCECIHSGAGA